MKEVLQCHTTNFETQGGLTTHQADSRSSKDRAIAQLSRLKERAGFQYHREHSRPYRDVPSLKKDLETALEATRKIQATHAGLLVRRQKTEQDYPLSESAHASFLMDVTLSNRANESLDESKRTNTYPLNNVIFNTLWQKIFLPKNFQERSIATEESVFAGKKEVMRLPKLQIEKRGRKVDKSSFIREESNFQGQTKEQKCRYNPNKSYDCAADFVKKLDQKSEMSLKLSQAKDQLSGIVRKPSDNPGKQRLSKNEKSRMSLADVFRNPYKNLDFKVSKKRGGSILQKEASLDNSFQIHESLKYESESKKNYILRRKFDTSQMLD